MTHLSKDIPQVFHHYFRMWNETDPSLIRGHLEMAVSSDCLWVDPQHSHTGHDGLEKNVKGFREKFPNATLEICSNVDSHNQRYRYEWVIKNDGQHMLDGFDVASLNDDGLIERVDGFFGRLKRES